ncbi:MAG: amidohydrolase family protein, partial [Gammaproteobacteria bacterium]|nr:amidohydrolase family protein [Gammaproteobacteria bacterium]
WLGDDNIVISTDYPHADSRWPEAVASFLKIDGLREAAKRKIFWDNSAKLYNLQ